MCTAALSAGFVLEAHSTNSASGTTCGLSNGFRKSVLSVCPHEGHSMATYGQSSFETATPVPHASDRSPRGGDPHGPNHTSSGALCVELSELTQWLIYPK